MKIKLFDVVRLNKTIHNLKSKIKTLDKIIKDQENEYSETLLIKDNSMATLIERQKFELNQQETLFTKEMGKIREQEREQHQKIINEKNDEIIRLRELLVSKQKVFNTVKSREHDVDALVEDVFNQFRDGEDYFARGLQCFKRAKQIVDNSKQRHNRDDSKLLTAVSES